MKIKIGILMGLILAIPTISSAQGVMETTWIDDKMILYALYFVIFILLIFVLILFRVLNHLKSFLRGDFEKEVDKKNKFGGIERFLQLKPLSSDRDTLLDHDYDGIQELDNPPPPWFMFLFYGTILFAVIYLAGYSFTKAWPNQLQEYEMAMEAAKKKPDAEAGGGAVAAVIDESTVAASTDAKDIKLGKGIFASKCAACHNPGGVGGTGPNLTDEYWKNGGSDVDLFKTIKNGISGTSMISWDGQMSPKSMQDVISYIRTLEYVGPEAGGKDPEGEKYVPAEPSTDDTPEAGEAGGETEGETSEGTVTESTE